MANSRRTHKSLIVLSLLLLRDISQKKQEVDDVLPQVRD